MKRDKREYHVNMTAQNGIETDKLIESALKWTKLDENAISAEPD